MGKLILSDLIFNSFFIDQDMSVLQMGKMIYRNFGNSGLKVSAISFGNSINYKPQTYSEDKKIVEICLKNGINFFDTAERYAQGAAERQLGRIMRQLQVPRQEIVIATKVHTAENADMNSTSSTNRKHIRESIKKSLERLQMEYVDVLYAHLFDEDTPLEEICRAFHQVIEEGQSFYWATSNWEPQDVYRALAICQQNNLHKPIGAQNQYSMLSRQQNEVEYESLFSKYNYGLVGWSPLAGGFLTGKYLNGIPENELNRMTDKSIFFSMDLLRGLYYEPFKGEKTVKKLQDLEQFANTLGFKLTHLALAWAVKYIHLDSSLVGARTVVQLEDTLKAIDLIQKLTPEVEAKVNKILDTTPQTRMNFLNWTPYAPIRPSAS